MAREITINVKIDVQGHTTFDVEGAEGHGCKEATRSLEEAIGKVDTTEDKPEMYLGDGQGVSVSK